MAKKFENVAIIPQTKVRLNEIGKKGQTYDQIIQELLSKWDFENWMILPVNAIPKKITCLNLMVAL